jgi:hypothetical protein
LGSSSLVSDVLPTFRNVVRFLFCQLYLMLENGTIICNCLGVLLGSPSLRTCSTNRPLVTAMSETKGQVVSRAIGG